MKKKHYTLLVLVFICLYSASAQYNTIRIMSYNIEANKWRKDTIMRSKIPNVINSANYDYIGLQEVDSCASRTWSVDMTKIIRDTTNMAYSKFCKNFDFDPGFSTGSYGKATMSRHEIPISSRSVYLTQFHLKENEETINIDITEFEDFVIFNCHVDWGYGDTIIAHQARIQQVCDERHHTISTEADKYNKPVFLIGDLNGIPSDPDIRRLQKEDWIMLSDSTKNTFSENWVTFRKAIDYIFGYKKKGVTYNVLNAGVIKTTHVSDHLPIVVEVVPQNCEDMIINDNTIINSIKYGCGNIIVAASGTLTLNPNCELYMQHKTKIEVRHGGSLIISGGKIFDADISIDNGGSLTMENDGYVKLRRNGEFNIDDEAQLNWGKGEIVPAD